MPTIDAHYILAGGRSRRFGSDKARAEIDGQPLIYRVAERLWPQVPLGAVVAVADQRDRYADLGLRTIADPSPHRGPLHGLATALSHYRAQGGKSWVLLSACDLTEPSPEWVEPLHHTPPLSDSTRSLAYVDHQKRWQPLPSLHHVDALPMLRAALSSDERSLCRWLDRSAAQAVAFPAGRVQIPSANTRAELPPST